MPGPTVNGVDLWWTVIIGTGILLVLALGFVLLALYHERTRRNFERDQAEEYRRHLVESERLRSELAALTQKMMNMQEEEQARISRELHDEVGQVLTAIHTNLQVVLQDLRADEGFLRARLSESLSFSREVTRRIRSVIRALRPVEFKDEGLIPSLGKYVTNFQARTGIRATFSYDPVEEDLNLNQKVTIFRIVQECLTNIERHSGATEAQIVLLEKLEPAQSPGFEPSGMRFHLEVADNGRGMDLSASRAPDHPSVPPTAPEAGSGNAEKGFGLIGMQERIKLLSGTFQITASPQGGTRIFITLPRSGI